MSARLLSLITGLACMLVMSISHLSLGSEAAEQSYRIIHHDLKIELFPDRNYLTAEDRIMLKDISGLSAKEGPKFLLRRGLEVKDVRVGNTPVKYIISPVADARQFLAAPDSEDVGYFSRVQLIAIDAPLETLKQSDRTVSVIYEGVIKDSLAGADFSREYVAEQVTGVVGPEGIYLAPEGIYYPTIPDQLFTYTLQVTLPQEFQSVSEGIDQETVLQAGKRTETWLCDHPIDGFHLLAGKYQVSTVEHANVRISTYFFPDTTDLAQKYLEACKGYIDLYDQLLGPYPFQKFAVVENFFATGYGMPSFTLLGSEVIRLPFIISTSLGHEVCHNWWGNSVFVDYATGNWCEGLTTYCADYLYKERRSPAEAQEYRLGLDRDYTAYAHENNDFALSEFRVRHNPAQRAVGYGKSAMVYHMLRRQVGDEFFWNALRQFYQGEKYQFASWGDLQKSFEAESGSDLGWFFEQWIKRPGAPLLSLQSPSLKEEKGQWIMQFILEQKQAEDPFVLGVPVQIKGEKQDTTIWVRAAERREEVNLAIGFRPQSLAVDPHFDLFRRLDRAEIAPTLAEVLGAADLIIVLPTNAPDSLLQAYKSLAGQLNREGHYRLLNDSDLKPEDLNNRSLLFLGAQQQNKAIPAAWIKDKPWSFAVASYHLLNADHADPNAAMLVVDRHPANKEITLAYFAARTAAGVLEAGRKLPHYGKYSYLVFYGGKNQVKGTWEATQSPLMYTFPAR